MPWLSKVEFRRLLRSVIRAEYRADRAESALKQERRENRDAERHLTNQFLRKMNAYPQPAEKVGEPAPPLEAAQRTLYDPGELAALEAEAERLGLSREDARAFFMKEKDIDVLM